MFKGSVNKRKIIFLEFKEVVRIAFKLLKIFFIRALMLILFDSRKLIKIEMDISGFAIAGILLQSINKQLTNNASVYGNLKNDNSENSDPERPSHFIIKKESKHSQIY
jgi:hypothetical protein